MKTTKISYEWTQYIWKRKSTRKNSKWIIDDVCTRIIDEEEYKKHQKNWENACKNEDYETYEYYKESYDCMCRVSIKDLIKRENMYEMIIETIDEPMEQTSKKEAEKIAEELFKLETIEEETVADIVENNNDMEENNMSRYQKWYNEVSKYFNIGYAEMIEIIEENGYEYLYYLMKYFEENYELIETISVETIEEPVEIMTATKGENIFKGIVDNMLQQVIFEMMNEDYGEVVYLGDEEVCGLEHENIYKYVKYDEEYYAVQDKFNKIYYIPKDIFEIYFLIIDDKLHAWE